MRANARPTQCASGLVSHCRAKHSHAYQHPVTVSSDFRTRIVGAKRTTLQTTERNCGDAFRRHEQGQSGEISWGQIWEKFSALSFFQKKVAAFILLFLLLLLPAMPFLLLFGVFYILRPKMIKQHIAGTLDAFS